MSEAEMKREIAVMLFQKEKLYPWRRPLAWPENSPRIRFQQFAAGPRHSCPTMD